jgi:hypothetical protein
VRAQYKYFLHWQGSDRTLAQKLLVLIQSTGWNRPHRMLLEMAIEHVQKGGCRPKAAENQSLHVEAEVYDGVFALTSTNFYVLVGGFKLMFSVLPRAVAGGPGVHGEEATNCGHWLVDFHRCQGLRQFLFDLAEKSRKPLFRIVLVTVMQKNFVHHGSRPHVQSLHSIFHSH